MQAGFHSSLWKMEFSDSFFVIACEVLAFYVNYLLRFNEELTCTT